MQSKNGFDERWKKEKKAFADYLTHYRYLMSPPSLVKLEVGVEKVIYYANENELCKLSFFRAALQGGFKESSEKIIRLPEDDPDAVAILIGYLYTGTYVAKESDLFEISQPYMEAILYVKVHVLAEKYGCEELSNTIRGELNTKNRLSDRMRLELWATIYRTSQPTSMLRIKNRLTCWRKDGALCQIKRWQTQDAAEFSKICKEQPEFFYDLMLLAARDVGLHTNDPYTSEDKENEVNGSVPL